MSPQPSAPPPPNNITKRFVAVYWKEGEGEATFNDGR